MENKNIKIKTNIISCVQKSLEAEDRQTWKQKILAFKSQFWGAHILCVLNTLFWAWLCNVWVWEGAIRVNTIPGLVSEAHFTILRWTQIRQGILLDVFLPCHTSFWRPLTIYASNGEALLSHHQKGHSSQGRTDTLSWQVLENDGH